MESQSVQFGEIARTVAVRARTLGFDAPVFKSPPRIVGVTRTIRRRDDGTAVVAVAFRNRPIGAVIADLVEAVVVVNDVRGADASRLRDDLWHPYADAVQVAA